MKGLLSFLYMVSAVHVCSVSSFEVFQAMDDMRSAIDSFYDPVKYTTTRSKDVVVPTKKKVVPSGKDKGKKGAPGPFAVTHSILKSRHHLVTRPKFKLSSRVTPVVTKSRSQLKVLSWKPKRLRVLKMSRPWPVSVKHRPVLKLKPLPVQPFRPKPMLKAQTNLRPSTNKFAEAIEDIEKALADAQETTRTTHNVNRLARLKYLIKTAVRKRSYRFARKAIGEAMFTIMKLTKTPGKNRRRRAIQLSSKNFLGDVRQKIGQKAFADLLAMQGQVTLTFAIDTTGSMGDEIAAAKEIVQSIARQPRAEPVDYILSSFNDPKTGPVEYFEEGYYGSFIQSLQSIRVTGGGDCPELTFRGMKDAINIGQPQLDSPMYVFTDAGSKDGNIGNITEVIQIAKDSGIVVNFFVVDSGCSKVDNISPFDEVAEATTGQVFRLKDSNELKQLAGITANSLGGTAVVSTASKNVLTRKKRSNSKQTNQYTIPVDDSVNTLVISVTTNQPYATNHWDVSLSTPSDNIAGVTTQKLDKATVYQITNPGVGNWNLAISSDNSVDYEYYAKASSANNIDFQYYFVMKRKGALVPITSPVKGRRAQAILTLGGVENINTTSLRVELVTTYGQVLTKETQTCSLKPKDKKGIRQSLTFILPIVLFNIKLKGKTKKGHHFERICHNSIHSESLLIKVLYAKNDYTVSSGKSTFIMFTVENLGAAETVHFEAIGSLGTTTVSGQKSRRLRRRTTFTVTITIDKSTAKGVTATIVAWAKGGKSKSKATMSVPLLVV